MKRSSSFVLAALKSLAWRPVNVYVGALERISEVRGEVPLVQDVKLVPVCLCAEVDGVDVEVEVVDDVADVHHAVQVRPGGRHARAVLCKENVKNK